MPVVNPCPIGVKPQFELATGLPAVGNQLFFYVAGSVNTKLDTYTDSTGTVANSNPIVLNALGMPTTEIWFTAGQSYKVVYAPSTDTDPPTSPIWTIDNLRGINDTTVSVDQWISGPAPTYINATQFSLAGDQTSTFQVGRRVRTTNSGGTVYGTISGSAYGVLTTVTVVNDSGSLDAGLSAVSYGLLTPIDFSVPGYQAAGDYLTPNPAGTLSRLPAAATVAANATTSNIWQARYVTLSGGAVTFTDFADAPYAGATVYVVANAAHVLTDGANIEVQGNANYTCTAGDVLIVYAKTVSTFQVSIIRENGYSVSGGGWTALQTVTASNAATADLTVGFSSVYDSYALTVANVVPQTDATDLYLRISTDGGSTFLTTNIYAYENITGNGGAVVSVSSAGTSQLLVSNSLGTNTGEVLNAVLYLQNLSNASVYKSVHGTLSYLNSSAAVTTRTIGSMILTTTAINGIRLIMSSGNINGTFTLYGIRK